MLSRTIPITKNQYVIFWYFSNIIFYNLYNTN